MVAVSSLDCTTLEEIFMDCEEVTRWIGGEGYRGSGWISVYWVFIQYYQERPFTPLRQGSLTVQR